MSSLDPDQLRCTVMSLRQRLLALRQPAGHWVGYLSSSALSTATAVFALAQVDRVQHRALIDQGLSWLCAHQNADGKADPVYGTSRALTHLARVPDRYLNRTASMCDMARQWLLRAQNSDGGWGGAPKVVSSIEETALAVEALADGLLAGHVHGAAVLTAIRRGANWLVTHTDRGRSVPAAPIGLYFTQLWYHEELYPIVFSLSALAKAQRLFFA